MSQKFYSEVTLETLNNATTDTDRFLVGDSGTIKYRTGSQLLSDLGVSGLYVPYTGATGNVDLGTHTLSSYNLIVNHTSGSGVAASITKGGSGEALTINKSSGSGNAMSVIGGLTSLVDLTLSSIPNATIDTDRFIVSDGGAIKYRTGAQVLSDIGGQPALTNPITGTGTTNCVSKFTGATSLGDSQIFDTGTNVGIGTTNPNYQTVGRLVVDINGSSQSLLGFSIGTNPSAYIASTSTLTELASVSNPLLFTVGSERMRITSSGNVGIGVSDPISKLEVLSDFKVRNPSNSFVRFNFGWTNSNQTAYLDTYNFSTGARPDLSLQPDGGNVGIGTTSPSYKLDVVGNGRFSSDLLTTGRFGAGSTNVNSRIFASAFSGELSAAIFTTLNSAQSGQEAARFSTSDLVTGAVRIYPRVGLANYNGITVSDSAIIVNMPTKPLLVGVQDGSAVQFTETDIRIGTNNSEKMRITSTGNVGIGTTSPATQLHLNGSAELRFTNPTNTSGFDIGLLGGGSDANTYIYQRANSSMVFGTNNTERMRITASGNVGIGTTSPATKLDVRGDSGTSLRISSNDNYHIGALSWEDGTITLGAGGYGSPNLRFSTAGSERMCIANTGNVGIGTTTPTGAKLDVNGSIRGFGAGNAGRITSTDTSGGGASITMNPQFSTGVPGIESIGAFPIAFQTNSSEKMRITSGGNVGIGATSPHASALLHLKSNSQGFLPPVMKTGERNSISSPAVGLMIFNKDDDAVQVYTVEGWRTLAWA